MGYSHSWTRPYVIDSKVYENMRNDFIRLLDILPKSYPVQNHFYGVPLIIKGWDGKVELDLSDPELFKFNGDRSTYVALTMFDELEIKQLSHDTFSFNRKKHRLASEDDKTQLSAFCKTALKPYDLAVCGCLLIAKYYLQADFSFDTAGNIYTDYNWPEARRLVRQLDPKFDV